MFVGLLGWISSYADAVWYLAYWGLLAGIAALETVVPAFQQAPQREKRWPTNLGLGILNMLLAPLAPVSAVLAAQWAQNHGLGLLNAVATPWWLAVLATLAISDFVGYLFHVLMHKFSLFWRVHRVHHFDTHLDVSTALRHHPLEFGAIFFAMVPTAILFGLNPWALAAYEIIHAGIDASSHANLRLPQWLDRPFRWLFVTPNMHSLHHSTYQPETDSNYGQVFSVWDRLLGTHSAAPRAGYEAMQIGLDAIRDGRASELWWQIKSPFLSIARTNADVISDKSVRRGSV